MKEKKKESIRTAPCDSSSHRRRRKDSENSEKLTTSASTSKHRPRKEIKKRPAAISKKPAMKKKGKTLGGKTSRKGGINTTKTTRRGSIVLQSSAAGPENKVLTLKIRRGGPKTSTGQVRETVLWPGGDGAGRRWVPVKEKERIDEALGLRRNRHRFRLRRGVQKTKSA